MTSDTVLNYGTESIVPITKSDPESVSQLQDMAARKGFLSASYPGAYKLRTLAPVSMVKDTGRRKLKLKGN